LIQQPSDAFFVGWHKESQSLCVGHRLSMGSVAHGFEGLPWEQV